MRQDPRARHILAAALDAGHGIYADAISDLLLGQDPSGSWLRFRLVLARSMVLTHLVAIQAVTERAGVIYPAGDAVRPMTFVAVRPGIAVLTEAEDAAALIDGPFLAALEAFEGKVPRLRSTVEALAREAWSAATVIADAEHAGAVEALAARSAAIRGAVRGSFWASDADLSTIINLRDLVARSLRGEQVGGIPGFIREAELRGAANLTKARLETIYRTNIMGAYSEGQVAALREPEVEAAVPLVEIIEIDDRRSREHHVAMKGYINTLAEIERQGLVFPNGYNCRGNLSPVSVARARSMGLLYDSGHPNPVAIRSHNGRRQDLIDQGVYPDQGFA